MHKQNNARNERRKRHHGICEAQYETLLADQLNSHLVTLEKLFIFLSLFPGHKQKS